MLRNVPKVIRKNANPIYFVYSFLGKESKFLKVSVKVKADNHKSTVET